ncbi:MAG TPA: hypothetical protein VGJ32_00050 [Solirubrobacteraceae bacterium]
MRPLAPAALAAAALLAAGCGSPSADLFAVERAGSIPGARLRLVVNDAGTVRCDDRPAVKLTEAELLDARDLQRDLEDPAGRDLRLAPGPGSVLRYRVRTPDGTVSFADDSRGKPAVLDRLAFYVRRLARQRCGRPR